MMTIEQEIEHLIQFLKHPARFSVDLAGMLRISPIYGTTQHWEVYWEQIDDGIVYDYSKQFFDLEEAAQFFTEKRRYMCLGPDFNQIYNSEEKV